MQFKPVTARELSEYFGVTVETINRWVRERRVPFIRPSRRTVRFHLADVEKALHEQGVHHAAK